MSHQCVAYINPNESLMCRLQQSIAHIYWLLFLFLLCFYCVRVGHISLRCYCYCFSVVLMGDIALIQGFYCARVCVCDFYSVSVQILENRDGHL